MTVSDQVIKDVWEVVRRTDVESERFAALDAEMKLVMRVLPALLEELEADRRGVEDLRFVPEGLKELEARGFVRVNRWAAEERLLGACRKAAIVTGAPEEFLSELSEREIRESIVALREVERDAAVERRGALGGSSDELERTAVHSVLWALGRMVELRSTGQHARFRVTWRDVGGRREYRLDILRESGVIERPPYPMPLGTRSSVLESAGRGAPAVEHWEVEYEDEHDGGSVWVVEVEELGTLAMARAALASERTAHPERHYRIAHVTRRVVEDE